MDEAGLKNLKTHPGLSFNGARFAGERRVDEAGAVWGDLGGVLGREGRLRTQGHDSSNAADNDER